MTLPTDVFKCPPVKWCRIEEKAERLLEECRAFDGRERLPLPVPVERWIEHPLGYRFGIEDLSRLGPGVLGCVFIKEREILISDSIRNDGRFRFTWRELQDKVEPGNLRTIVLPVPPFQEQRSIVARLQLESPTLIYCKSSRSAYDLAHHLVEAGLTARNGDTESQR